MILKTIETRQSVHQILYSNVAVKEDDSLYAKAEKRKLRLSLQNFLRREDLRAEAILLENFDRSDWWCTLTFREEKLPVSRSFVNRRFNYFAAQLRAEGHPDLRYYRVPEHRHGIGRWHIHCVISGAPREAIRDIWMRIYGSPVDVPVIKPFDPSKVVPNGNNKGLASYLTKEAPDDLGRHNYSMSRGANRLRHPTVIRTIVPEGYEIDVPPGCRLIKRDRLSESPFGSTVSLRYFKPGVLEGELKGVELGTRVEN